MVARSSRVHTVGSMRTPLLLVALVLTGCAAERVDPAGASGACLLSDAQAAAVLSAPVMQEDSTTACTYVTNPPDTELRLSLVTPTGSASPAPPTSPDPQVKVTRSPAAQLGEGVELQLTTRALPEAEGQQLVEAAIEMPAGGRQVRIVVTGRTPATPAAAQVLAARALEAGRLLLVATAPDAPSPSPTAPPAPLPSS